MWRLSAYHSAVSEDAAEPTPAREPNQRLRQATHCGCLLVVLLLPAWGMAVYQRSQRTLDAALAAARSEVKARNAQLGLPRAPLFGEPLPGNAADDYLAALYVISANDPGRRPASWEDEPPLLPAEAITIATQLERAPPLTPAMSGDLSRYLAGAPIASATLAALTSYRPALTFLRSGVHRERCAWEVPWGEGWSASGQNLLSVRLLGQLLAVDAREDADSRRALRTGLEAVAFGRDLSRASLLINHLMAHFLVNQGCSSIAESMGRPGLRREDYALALRVLGEVELVPAQRIMDDEHLLARISLLADSGRRAVPDADSSLGGLYEFDIIGAWELGNLERVYGRTRPLLSAPRLERNAELRKLAQELEDSPSLVLGIARPDWSQVQDIVWGSRMTLQATRVLAAAHLFRLEQGRFPRQASELAPLLGGAFPRDIFARGPLQLRYDEARDELRCYSVGANGTDEQGSLHQGGKRKGDDCGVATVAPAR